MSSSQVVNIFGIPKHESCLEVNVRWNDKSVTTIKSPKLNQTLTINYIDKTNFAKGPQSQPLFTTQNMLDFKHKEIMHDDYASQVLLPHKLSQNGPFISQADLNNDKIPDLCISGARGQHSEIYFGKETVSGLKYVLQQKLDDVDSESLGSVFFDIDLDGDLDLYVVSGGHEFTTGDKRLQDHLYLNDGFGTLSKSTADLSFTKFDGQKAIANDFNQDGYVDLFVGSRSLADQYPSADASVIIINSNGTLKLHQQLNLGMLTDAVSFDCDQDGDSDIITVGEWAPINLLKNNGSGNFSATPINLANHASTAWWWAVEKGDFNEDGAIDFIIGNLGLNNKFKPSPYKPFDIFAGDLDNNGDHDVVLAKTIGDKRYPVRGKECSTEEMPFISVKFESYDAFAKASLDIIYDKRSLNQSQQSSILDFQHYILINDKQGGFKAQPLPRDLQRGTIKDIIVHDFNKDGHLDFMQAGNHYPTEVETVRYDANKGQIALGNGDGSFSIMDKNSSGIYLNADIRSLCLIHYEQSTYLITGINNDNCQSYMLNE